MLKVLHLPPDGKTKIWHWELENKIIYKYLFTADHLTLVRPVTTLILLRLTILEMISTRQFIGGIIVCVLSDLFDGPLARVLREKYGIEPRPFFLARWIPLFQGGHFDTLSDKFALATGIYIAIYFGYPWLPLIGMFSYAIVKTVSSFHGAWLVGFKYRELGLALLGLGSPDLGQRLREFDLKSTQSLLEGKVATICQVAVLGLAASWTMTPWPYFVTFGYTMALATIICDFIAYRKYLQRYLENNNGEFSSHPHRFFTQVKIELPFQEENCGPVALPTSSLLLMLGGYYLVNPVQISPD